MADLGDIFDIATDIAELFFDSRNEMRQKAKQKTSSRASAKVYPSEESKSSARFSENLQSNNKIAVYEGFADETPKSPLTTEDSTAAEYCETCLEESSSSKPAVKLNRRNLRQAFLLSEVIAPPLSRRGRRLF